jgi:hypothetical protein
MMRIQYEKIIQATYQEIDMELEMDTEEGRAAFVAMSQALFSELMKGKQKHACAIPAKAPPSNRGKGKGSAKN